MRRTGMVRCEVYASEALPVGVKWQILSYVRVEWWWVFQGKNRLWDYTQKGTRPVNVVLMEEDVLVSHAEVNWRMLAHEGEVFKVYGLSAVFTYPAFRKEGFGRQVTQAATEYILSSDGDVAMLFCLPELVPFYEGCGWVAMGDTTIWYGDQGAPAVDEEEVLMMLFVSARGKGARERFEGRPVYVGAYTW
jgi:GNAT superfamily N-acetyltransferase